jgi:flagellar protein FliS
MNKQFAAAYASMGYESRATERGGVVSMLYEGLLERLQLTQTAMGQRDIANKVRHLNKALQILNEGLRTHLDLKSGGELAENLDQLYAYCGLRLLQANAQSDAAAIQEVSKLIQTVADAWKQMQLATDHAPHESAKGVSLTLSGAATHAHA